MIYHTKLQRFWQRENVSRGVNTLTKLHMKTGNLTHSQTDLKIKCLFELQLSNRMRPKKNSK